MTIDKKRDEVKTCIIESLEYFGGTPREIWFDNMATVMVKEGKTYIPDAEKNAEYKKMFENYEKIY